MNDEDECRKSSGELGKEFNGAGCYSTEVPGCLDNGPYIYFSTCQKTHNKNHAGVCKGKFLELPNKFHYSTKLVSKRMFCIYY